MKIFSLWSVFLASTSKLEATKGYTKQFKSLYQHYEGQQKGQLSAE